MNISQRVDHLYGYNDNKENRGGYGNKIESPNFRKKIDFKERLKEQEEVYFKPHNEEALKPCYSDSTSKGNSEIKYERIFQRNEIKLTESLTPKLEPREHDEEDIPTSYSRIRRRKKNLDRGRVKSFNSDYLRLKDAEKPPLSEPKRSTSLKPILKNHKNSKKNYKNEIYYNYLSKTVNISTQLKEAKELWDSKSAKSNLDKSQNSEKAKFLTSYHLKSNPGKIENEISQIINLQISEKRIIKILTNKLKEKVSVIENLKNEYKNLFENFEEVCKENKELEKRMIEIETKSKKKKVTIFTPSKIATTELTENDFSNKYHIEDEYKLKTKPKCSLRTQLKTYLRTSNLSQNSKFTNTNFSNLGMSRERRNLSYTQVPPRRANSLTPNNDKFSDISKENKRYKKFVQAVVKLAKKLTPEKFGKRLERDGKNNVKYLWKWLKSFFEEYMRVKMSLAAKNEGFDDGVRVISR